MSEPDSPLEPRDVALLREARDADAPGAETRARVHARLAASLLAAPPRGPGASPATHAAATGSSILSKGILVTTALLVGGAAGAGLYAGLRPAPPPRVVYVPQPIVMPGPPAPTAAPTQPPAPQSTTSPSRTAAPPAPSSRTTQLEAERLLLDEARAALVQGEPARALDRVERHRRAFPTPILAEERDAMEVEALAKAGRGAEARAKADAFRRRWTDSLFLPAVETAVESIP